MYAVLSTSAVLTIGLAYSYVTSVMLYSYVVSSEAHLLLGSIKRVSCNDRVREANATIHYYSLKQAAIDAEAPLRNIQHWDCYDEDGITNPSQKGWCAFAIPIATWL
jgi:hypothetical protein